MVVVAVLVVQSGPASPALCPTSQIGGFRPFETLLTPPSGSSPPSAFPRLTDVSYAVLDDDIVCRGVFQHHTQP